MKTQIAQPKPKAYSVVLLCLLLPVVHSHGVGGVVQADEASLVTRIDRSALEPMLGMKGQLSVDDRGCVVRLVRRMGVSDKFLVGVHPTLGEADSVWKNLTPPQDAQEQAVTGIADRLRVSRLIGSEAYQVALRRLNVVSQFVFRGTQEDALVFARKLDAALQSDAKLAPRGKNVSIPELEILAPALVSVAQGFPIIYRTPRTMFVSVVPHLQAEAMGAKTTVTIDIPHAPLMSPSGRLECSLETTGAHQLTVTFVTWGAVVFRRSINVRVMTTGEAVVLGSAETWALPEKAVYFLPKVGPAWTAIPEGEREQIVLQRKFLSPLKPEPEEEWWRLRAWNDLTQFLKLEWLPSREMMHVFENGARPTRERAAYCSYRRGNLGIIVLSEIGKQAWVYIEQPGTSVAEQKTPEPHQFLVPEVAHPDWARSDSEVFPGFPYMARTCRRQRLLTPNGAPEAVQILLLHIGQPQLVNLHFPGYTE